MTQTLESVLDGFVTQFGNGIYSCDDPLDFCMLADAYEEVGEAGIATYLRDMITISYSSVGHYVAFWSDSCIGMDDLSPIRGKQSLDLLEADILAAIRRIGR